MQGVIGILRKTTLVDYPGMPAAAIFLHGCNLHCRYCYNVALSGEEFLAADSDAVTKEQLFSYLKKRRGVLSALVITGGEALFNPNLFEIIKQAKELGYLIKLDTNGTFPKKLSELLSNSELSPDYIALDIKTSPNRYCELSRDELVANFNSPGELETSIKESIKILSKLKPDVYEFRTVLVPTLVEKNDIKSLAKLLPKDCKWYFSKFVAGKCLDTHFNSIEPYTQKKVDELVKYAKRFIPGAILRT